MPSASSHATLQQRGVSIGIAVLVSMAAGASIAVPELYPIRDALIAILLVALLLAARPEIFIGIVLGATGAIQVFDGYSIATGPATIYASDVLVGLVLLRGVRFVPRRTRRQAFTAFTVVAAVLLGVLMASAVARAVVGGTPPDEAVRAASPLFYWPALLWGYSRVLREKALDPSRLLRVFVAVCVALIAYMFVMRGLGRPFERPGQIGTLGIVESSTGDTTRRDYGFYSAFIFYPVLALLAMSVLLYTRRSAGRWALLAVIGTAATLLTLIRAEIFGLFAGIAVLFVLAPDGPSRRIGSMAAQRWRLVALGLAGLTAGAAMLIAVDPALARVVLERAVPLVAESSQSAENREYRLQAMESGLRVAGEHVLGLGFVSPQEVLEAGVADISYLGHSTFGAVLVYLGWPGLLALATLSIALVVNSARAPAAGPWFHPFFVSTLVMMLLYGLGAIGLFGQTFVMSLGAFVVAWRFSSAVNTV